MHPAERFSLLAKLCLLFLLVILLNVHPVSFTLEENLRQARIAQRQDQPADAAAALRRAIAREPWRTALWEQVGRYEILAGRLEQAAQALLEAERFHGLTDEGRMLLADTYNQLGDPSAAEAILQALLEGGGPVQAYERLAQLQRARGDFPAALATLSAWRAADGDNPQAAYLLGLFLSVTQPEAALPLLLEASQKDSSYTPAVQVIRRGLVQFTAAEDPAYASLMVGRSLGTIEQWDLAAQAFQRSVDLAPAYGEAWAFLGEARYHVDGGGRAELQQAQQLAPDSMVVRVLLALSYRRSGDTSQALEYLLAIAEQEPEEPVWQVEIAYTYLAVGDLSAARAYFEKAVQLEPENTLYWQYLARFSAEYSMEPRDLGLPAARQAVLLAPNDPAALDTMGQVLVRLGDDASAERFLQQALDRDATYAPAYLHLGQIYLPKDAQRAYPFLKRAAALAGETATGKVAVRLLKIYFGEDG